MSIMIVVQPSTLTSKVPPGLGFSTSGSVSPSIIISTFIGSGAVRACSVTSNS